MATATEIQSLLELPLGTLVVLAAGYLSYRLAYTGKDHSHGPIDIIFLTFVFAAVARAIAFLVSGLGSRWLSTLWSEVMPFLLGLVLAIALAAFWRVKGAGTVFRFLRSTGISADDRHLTAWQTMLDRQPKAGPSRLQVTRTDGTRLLCDRLADFADAPLGPCILGTDGSIAMYVTDKKVGADAEWQPIQSPAEAKPDWGLTLSYIPASTIVEVSVTYPFNPSVSAEMGKSERSA